MKWLGRLIRKLVKWTLIVFGGLTVLGLVLTIFFAEPLTEEEKAKREAIRIEQEAERATESARKETERAEAKAKQDAENLAEKEAELAEAAETKRKGFHCLSAWDGSHANFKREVKSMMREPDSFEHISTRVTPVSDAGTHTVLMEYRARNGFGGMNVGTARGVYKNLDCSHTVISVD